MTLTPLVSVGVLILLLGLAVAAWRRRYRPETPREKKRPRSIGSVGPGAAGAFYEFLNEDKRKAIEIVLEERASYADPETRDGDLPQFEIRGLSAPPSSSQRAPADDPDEPPTR